MDHEQTRKPKQTQRKVTTTEMISTLNEDTTTISGILLARDCKSGRRQNVYAYEDTEKCLEPFNPSSTILSQDNHLNNVFYGGPDGWVVKGWLW